MPNTDPASLRVVVLAGGRSSEREISLESGAAIKKGLIDAGFASVDMIDPSDEGAIVALAQGAYDVAFIGLHKDFHIGYLHFVFAAPLGACMSLSPVLGQVVNLACQLAAA